MVYRYIIVSLIIMVLLTMIAVFSPISNDKKMLLYKRAISCIVLGDVANVLYLVLPDKTWQMFFKGLYFASISWAILGYLHIVLLYAGKTKSLKWIKFWSALCIIDSVCLLTNPWTCFAFPGAYKNVLGNQVLVLGKGNVGMYFHMIMCYLMITTVCLNVVIKAAGETTAYFVRYLGVCAVTILCMGINYISITQDSALDYTFFLYAILCCYLGHILINTLPFGFRKKVMAQITDNQKDGVVAFDHNGKVIYFNSAAKDIVPSDDPKTEFEEYYAQKISNAAVLELVGSSWETSFVTYGEKKHYYVSMNKLIDERQLKLGSYMIFCDRTKELQELRSEKYKANHDALTRLYNRQFFYEQAGKMIRENSDSTYMMVCSDIKEFKLFNDIFGIEAGNQILVRIARLLSAFVKDDAVYGRLHGDVFAVCLPKEKYYEGIFIECMRQVSKSAESRAYRLHIHMGVYEINNPYMSVAVMCDRALMAIASIKESFTEQIAYYGEELRQKAMEEQWIISQFQDALNGGEFQGYLQPQISSDGECMGAEMLARWIHPVKGVISPAFFIKVLEDTALVYKLDMFIWELACRKIAEWIDKGITDKYVSVNISTRDFYYVNISKTLCDLTDKYHIPRSLLRLEITETVFMTDSVRQIAMINELKSQGFTIEMDDFGSGYSSLNMLKDIDIDVVKLDMGFLSYSQGEKANKILKMVVNLTKEMNIGVISEGVETKEQFEYLRDIGCNLFQGFFFAKPISIAEFESKYLGL